MDLSGGFGNMALGDKKNNDEDEECFGFGE